MRTLSLAVALLAVMALAASVTTASHAGSSDAPSGGSAGVAVSATTQTTLAVQVAGTSIVSASLSAWCYSGSSWGRTPAFDVGFTRRQGESPSFLSSAPMTVPPNCTRLYWQTTDIRPQGLSHTVSVSLTAAANASSCDSLTIRATSCGTSPANIPLSRTAYSTSLEVTNSAENAGSPKVKCQVDPEDGGVGFGGTYPGLVRSPGESMFFSIDDTHTLVCVCDTPGTAVITTECVP